MGRKQIIASLLPPKHGFHKLDPQGQTGRTTQDSVLLVFDCILFVSLARAARLESSPWLSTRFAGHARSLTSLFPTSYYRHPEWRNPLMGLETTFAWGALPFRGTFTLRGWVKTE